MLQTILLHVLALAAESDRLPRGDWPDAPPDQKWLVNGEANVAASVQLFEGQTCPLRAGLHQYHLGGDQPKEDDSDRGEDPGGADDEERGPADDDGDDSDDDNNRGAPDRSPDGPSREGTPPPPKRRRR